MAFEFPGLETSTMKKKGGWGLLRFGLHDKHMLIEARKGHPSCGMKWAARWGGYTNCRPIEDIKGANKKNEKRWHGLGSREWAAP